MDVPADGVYKFFLTSDNGAVLILNGALVVDNGGYHGLQTDHGSVRLRKGAQKIEIRYYERTYSATLKLEWSGPGFARREVAESDLWRTTDTDNPQLAEYFAMRLDSDGDGLPDYLEYLLGADVNDTDSDGDGLNDGDEVFTYGTDPMKSDTDGDGVSDYAEVNGSGTNPLVAEFDPDDVEDVLAVKGADYSSLLGGWGKIGDSAYCYGRRGYVEYSVDLPVSNTYRLKLNISEHLPNTSSIFDLKISIDGERVSRSFVASSSEEPAEMVVFTPHLAAGSHTVKIFWDGYASYQYLQINKLTFQRLGGPDADGNGKPDWIDERLDSLCSIDGAETAQSAVSPACVEGKGRYLSMMTLSGGITPKKSVNDRWFADIPLNPELPVNLTATFQNGAKTISKDLIWDVTNIAVHSSTVTIRKGDSLLLDMLPAGATGGTYSITGGPEPISGNAGTPAPTLFDTAGDFTLNGTHTADDGTVTEATLEVKVLEYSFNSDSPVCWADRTRTWDAPKTPEGVTLSTDSRVADFSLQPTQPENATRVDLALSDNDDKTVLARVGEEGAILDSAIIRGTAVFSANKTYVRRIETYEDGTKVYEMLIVASPPRDDVTVNLHIFVSGVIFEDGTIDKTLTSSDFDAAGMTKVRFIYPPEATTSTCHTLKLYQNGLYIGKRF